MIVASFWAEARQQHRAGGKQITVRRFGWSDISHDDAQAMAEARAKEALARAVAGQKVVRRELKETYNGAEGQPIREEIVARYGDAVITRNSYGARCLNTPDALFADIDDPELATGVTKFQLFLGLAAILGLAGWKLHAWWLGVGMAILPAFVVGRIVDALAQFNFKRSGGEAGRLQKQIERIETFVASHPLWGIRIYKTPSGLRTLATHQPFDPSDPAVAEYFRAVGSDPIYVLMCVNQRCFRARLTAKPWRIGIDAHMKPRPGIWPVRPERLAERAAWIEAYEVKAKDYAACTFLRAVGRGGVHPRLQETVEVHDRECRAASSMLPLA